jgi:hypothetical protein
VSITRPAPGRFYKFTARIVAHRVHAQSVEVLAKQIEEAVAKGLQAAGAGEIARYELLWAEVELARVEDRLPEAPEKLGPDCAFGKLTINDVELLFRQAGKN